MTIPTPPSISPDEMNLLRTVSAMAWADGDLAPEEADVLLSHLSELFTDNEHSAAELRRSLQDYISQNIPLEESVPKLKTEEDRELVLKLGYLVILASGRKGEETLINREEKVAYRRLVDLLGLSEEAIERIEWAAEDELKAHGYNIVHAFGSGVSQALGR